MGQGRNTVFLAQQGWEVTGVDVADEGLSIANRAAQKAGVEISTVLQSAYEFDFGKEKWDLVAIIYFGARRFPEKLKESLKPGGIVVVEGFHKEATRNARIGAGVVWETNELMDLFRNSGFRILHYEDTVGIADYGKKETRLVKLAAQKPQ
jgi:2-polyprenyl-3-methyl-5-hydroxy-6-metoxy-1,4-benzoquinol methylase